MNQKLIKVDVATVPCDEMLHMEMHISPLFDCSLACEITEASGQVAHRFTLPHLPSHATVSLEKQLSDQQVIWLCVSDQQDGRQSLMRFWVERQQLQFELPKHSGEERLFQVTLTTCREQGERSVMATAIYAEQNRRFSSHDNAHLGTALKGHNNRRRLEKPHAHSL